MATCELNWFWVDFLGLCCGWIKLWCIWGGGYFWCKHEFSYFGGLVYWSVTQKSEEYLVSGVELWSCFGYIFESLTFWINSHVHFYYVFNKIEGVLTPKPSLPWVRPSRSLTTVNNKSTKYPQKCALNHSKDHQSHQLFQLVPLFLT